MSSPPTNARQPVVLQIAGQRLRLNANADEGHLEGLAAQVNARYDAIQRATRNAIPATVLALVSLDLADEIGQLKKRIEDMESEFRAKLAAADARAREIESAARRAVAEALTEIDRALELDEQRDDDDKDDAEDESESA